MEPSISRIAELQQLIADFSKIQRVPLLADTGRRENDVEHSYGLALTAWFLASKIAPDLNQEKILKYALAHDIVELYAGDTFVFGDTKAIKSKPKREKAALERLANEWPDFTEMIDYAKNYIDKADEEAKFVYSIDKMLPVIMVNLGEKEKFWNRHKISHQAQADEKKPKLQVSRHVAPYTEEFIRWMSEPDYFYKDEDETDSPSSNH
jgi:putative hydrolases of HD superfamily